MINLQDHEAEIIAKLKSIPAEEWERRLKERFSARNKRVDAIFRKRAIAQIIVGVIGVISQITYVVLALNSSNLCWFLLPIQFLTIWILMRWNIWADKYLPLDIE